jgi:hypothetical protein
MSAAQRRCQALLLRGIAKSLEKVELYELPLSIYRIAASCHPSGLGVPSCKLGILTNRHLPQQLVGSEKIRKTLPCLLNAVCQPAQWRQPNYYDLRSGTANFWHPHYCLALQSSVAFAKVDGLPFRLCNTFSTRGQQGE